MSGPIVRSGPSEKFTENWGNIFSGGKKQATAKKPAAKKVAKKKAAPVKAKSTKKKK